ELAIAGVPRQNGSGLALRVHVPAEVAGGTLVEVLLALDRKSCATAAERIVPLHAHVLPFGGLAAEVSREGKALQVRAVQVALGELLARVAHPAGAGNRPRLDAACADRLVGGLQKALSGGLVWVRLILRHRRPDHQGRYSKQQSQLAFHVSSPPVVVPR